MLKAAVGLRGQSVRGQLNGTIPSTREGQKVQPEQLVEADTIDLRTMGSDSIGEEVSGGDSDGQTVPQKEGTEVS